MKTICTFLFLIILSAISFSQPVDIDRIIVHVGNEIVLLSDVEMQLQQYRQMNPGEEIDRCMILEEMIIKKLLLHQAALDSVEISDNQVDGELDRRLRYFISQLGSEERLEQYYDKSIPEIKAEFRSSIKEQLMIQTVQQKITGNIKITPSEVRSFFEQIPEDSLPLINSELEIEQIVKLPSTGVDEKERVKVRLTDIRNRITGGEDFGTLAYLYSEDPGSAKKNGELGFTERADLVPEFATPAFNLKENEVSSIIETKFGFHIIQLIERRGDRINVRHILLKPKVSDAGLANAKFSLDTIVQKINSGKISFSEAAIAYSDDSETAKNGGLLLNPNTGTSRFETPHLDPTLYFVSEKMKTGDVSEPVPFATREGKDAYRIVLLKSRTDPHKANLKDDYQKIQEFALADKQQKTLRNWVLKKKKSVFITVDTAFSHCDFVKEVLK